MQVYVRAFPDKGGKWQISNSGGTNPMWSRNGHECFSRLWTTTSWRQAYTVKIDSFEADKPRLWSEKQLGTTANNVNNVALAPDGKRIVALSPAETAEGQKAQSHVIFLENFVDEVRRKVPVSKYFQSRLTPRISNKNQHFDVVWPDRVCNVGQPKVTFCQRLREKLFTDSKPLANSLYG